MVDTDGPESITHRASNAKKKEKKKEMEVLKRRITFC